MSDMQRLNDVIFDQLDALMIAKASDPEQFDAEIKRSKAVSDLGMTLIQNNRLALDATKVAVELKGPKFTKMPTMLALGESDG